MLDETELDEQAPLDDVRSLVNALWVTVKISTAQADFLAHYDRHLPVGENRLSVADTLSMAKFARSKARSLRGLNKHVAATLERRCHRSMNEAAVLCRRLARELEGLAR